MGLDAGRQDLGLAHGGRAHDYQGSAQRQPAVRALLGPDPARHLDFDVHRLQQPLDHGVVVAGSAGGVEVDHVQPLGARGGVRPGQLDRVVRVLGRLLIVTLDEPHAAPAEDVDRGYDQHVAQFDAPGAPPQDGGATPPHKGLPVIYELERDRYVLRLAQRLDRGLQ